MTDSLTAALACAALLTGLPPSDTIPGWEQRELTKVERWLTNRPQNARAMYDYPRMTIVTLPGDWSALVHESVHHLEYMAGEPFDEFRADMAEIRSEECRPRTDICTLNGEVGGCTVTVEVMQ